MQDPALDMTAPKQEMSGSGTPTGRVNLDQSLLDKIKAAATTKAPANKVVDAVAKPAPAPEPKDDSRPAQAKAAEPAKQAVATPPAPDTKSADAPATSGGDDKGKTPKEPKQLREAYERATAKAEELERSFTATAKEKADAYAKVAELEAKNRAYEERVQKEFEPAIKRLTETEKKLQEREEALRMRDYTATPEWHERYIKPIMDVQEEAKSLLGELVVQVEGKDVAAGAEHLNYVIGAPNAMEAHRRAEQLFGPFASKIVDYRTKLRALEGKRTEALSKAQLESAEWAKRQQEEQQAAQAQFKQLVQQKVQQYLPRLAEDDPEEANAMLEGVRFSEQLEQGAQDPQVWADMVARVKGTVTAEKVQALRLKRAEATIADLRKELAAFQKSEPEVATRNAGQQAAPEGEDRFPGLMEKIRSVARGRQ